MDRQAEIQERGKVAGFNGAAMEPNPYLGIEAMVWEIGRLAGKNVRDRAKRRVQLLLYS